MPESTPTEHLLIRLRLDRVRDATLARTFSMVTQPYRRRLGERVEADSFAPGEALLPWSEGLVADLIAASAMPADEEAGRRLGRTLRGALLQVDWASDEARIEQALAQGRQVRVVFHTTAMELVALPWGLMPLGDSGRPLCEHDRIAFVYHPSGTRVARLPEPPPPRDRVLFAWATGGSGQGAVPAATHREAILIEPAARAAWFDPGVDELQEVSRSSLLQRLTEAVEEGEPYTVLHLLCHGAQVAADGRSLVGLVWSDGTSGGTEIVDSARLSSLLAEFAGSLRAVWLFACRSASAGGVVSHLGSVAEALHALGIETVLASRFPLSVEGSCTAARRLYRELLLEHRSVEAVTGLIRAELCQRRVACDHAALQLFGHLPPGGDLRPFAICPYVGEAAFEERHAPFFFGRAEEAEQLVTLLAGVGPHRLVIVSGDAGSGKTSLVMAGLLPRWREGREGRAARWVPQARPVAGLLAVVSDLLGTDVAPDAEALRRAFEARAGAEELLLFVDPLGELWSDDPARGDREERAERRELLTLLWWLAERMSVVLAARTEHLAALRLLASSAGGEALAADLVGAGRCVELGSMKRPQLEQVVDGPAARVGISLTDGLRDRLLDEVGRLPGNLPVLQLTLRRLWRPWQGGRLGQEDHTRIGGVRGVVCSLADEVFEEVADADKRAAVILMLHLRSPVDEPPDRRAVQWAHIAPARPDVLERLERVVRVFVERRLLVEVVDGGVRTLEVAHESLLRWQKLRDWTTVQRRLVDLFAAQRRLIDRQAEFSGWFWSPSLLASVLQLAGRLGDDMSVAVRDRRDQLVRLAAAVTVFTALTVLLAVFGTGAYLNGLRDAAVAQSQSTAAANLLRMAAEKAQRDPTLAQAALRSLDTLDDAWFERVQYIAEQPAAVGRLVWSDPVLSLAVSVAEGVEDPTLADLDLLVLTGLQSRDATAWLAEADEQLPCERVVREAAVAPSCRELARDVTAWAGFGSGPNLALVYGDAEAGHRLCVAHRGAEPGSWGGLRLAWPPPEAAGAEVPGPPRLIAVRSTARGVLVSDGRQVFKGDPEAQVGISLGVVAACDGVAETGVGWRRLDHAGAEVKWVGFLAAPEAELAAFVTVKDYTSQLWVLDLNGIPQQRATLDDHVHSVVTGGPDRTLLLLGHGAYVVSLPDLTGAAVVQPLLEVDRCGSGAVEKAKEFPVRPVLGAVSDDGGWLAVADLQWVYAYQRQAGGYCMLQTQAAEARSLGCSEVGCRYGLVNGEYADLQAGGQSWPGSAHEPEEVSVVEVSSRYWFTGSMDGTVRAWPRADREDAPEQQVGEVRAPIEGAPAAPLTLAGDRDELWVRPCPAGDPVCAGLARARLLAVSGDGAAAVVEVDGALQVHDVRRPLRCPTLVGDLPGRPAGAEPRYYVDSRLGDVEDPTVEGVVLKKGADGSLQLHACVAEGRVTRLARTVSVDPSEHLLDGVRLEAHGAGLLLRLRPVDDVTKTVWRVVDLRAGWEKEPSEEIAAQTARVIDPRRWWAELTDPDPVELGFELAGSSGIDAAVLWPGCAAVTVFGGAASVKTVESGLPGQGCCETWCREREEGSGWGGQLSVWAFGSSACTRTCSSVAWPELTRPPAGAVAHAVVRRVQQEGRDEIVVALASARGHLSVRRWEIAAEGEVRRFESYSRGGAPRTLVLRPDGAQVLTVDGLGVWRRAVLWPAEAAGDPAELSWLEQPDALLAAAYTPDGDRVVRLMASSEGVRSVVYSPARASLARKQIGQSHVCLTHTELRQFVGVDAALSDDLWKRCVGPGGLEGLAVDPRLVVRPRGLQREWPPAGQLVPLPEDCEAWARRGGLGAESVEVAQALERTGVEPVPVHEASLYLGGHPARRWEAWCLSDGDGWTTWLPLVGVDPLVTEALTALASEAGAGTDALAALLAAPRPGNVAVHRGAGGEVVATVHLAVRVGQSSADGLWVDPVDARFARSFGPPGLSAPFGTAVAGPGMATGLLAVDLCGTPFEPLSTGTLSSVQGAGPPALATTRGPLVATVQGEGAWVRSASLTGWPPEVGPVVPGAVRPRLHLRWAGEEGLSSCAEVGP
jgi:hypothetical protein